MDVLPEHVADENERRKMEGFNPCFSGCPSRTILDRFLECNQKGFNPCFSGCPSRTKSAQAKKPESSLVSILVLVDVLPEHG